MNSENGGVVARNATDLNSSIIEMQMAYVFIYMRMIYGLNILTIKENYKMLVILVDIYVDL